jgi:hypothetical protein
LSLKKLHNRSNKDSQEAPLTQLGRRFGLSNELGSGVWCDENGVFVGGVPLLEQSGFRSGPDQWQPRPVFDLNRDLSGCYGLPVEFTPKIGGLAAASRALNRGDMLHAQIATMHLQIPDPPPLTKSPRSAEETIDLARQLRASGLLKADWDPTKHPRWPAGSPSGIGGEFAPAGIASPGETSAQVIPAQITFPAPLELPGTIPFPSEILPPLAIPDINPRSNLRNPYPDREGCDEEWAHALEYCHGLLDSKRMGKDGSRGFGNTFQQCVLGMVSERCGGSLRS